MGWNNRVVRKKHVWTDAKGRTRTDYTYGIYEAYYDKNGKVVAITEEEVSPFGETATELRRSWIQMAGAFGQPILDYDVIPEPGYDTEDPLVKIPDLKKELEAELVSASSEESADVTEQEPLLKDFDHAAYEKEQEVERVSSEQDHNNNYVAIHPLKDLVDKILNDYQESRKKD